MIFLADAVAFISLAVEDDGYVYVTNAFFSFGYSVINPHCICCDNARRNILSFFLYLLS